MYIVTEKFILENYKSDFYNLVFHFFIPKVFLLVSGWFLPPCLDWSGNYSYYAEYTIQPLDRLDLKLTLVDRSWSKLSNNIVDYQQTLGV